MFVYVVLSSRDFEGDELISVHEANSTAQEAADQAQEAEKVKGKVYTKYRVVRKVLQ